MENISPSNGKNTVEKIVFPVEHGHEKPLLPVEKSCNGNSGISDPKMIPQWKKWYFRWKKYSSGNGTIASGKGSISSGENLHEK